MSSISPNKRRTKPVVVAETPVSALEDHLGYWLRAVSNHVSQAFSAKVEQEGVTVAEWVVLRALYMHSAKPSELAEQIGRTRGAVSKLLDRLVAKELVVVTDDPDDRRAQLVTLRPTGRRLVPKLAALADANDAAAFGHLSVRDRKELRKTLEGLATHLGIVGGPLE